MNNLQAAFDDLIFGVGGKEINAADLSQFTLDHLTLIMEAARKYANPDTVLITWEQLRQLAGFLSTIGWVPANEHPEDTWDKVKEGLAALGVTGKDHQLA